MFSSRVEMHLLLSLPKLCSSFRGFAPPIFCCTSKWKRPTVVPVPEVVCVADGVDGEVVDDTARGHVRVSLRVNVGVTFPRLPRPELCTDTRSYEHNFPPLRRRFGSSLAADGKAHLAAR